MANAIAQASLHFDGPGEVEQMDLQEALDMTIDKFGRRNQAIFQRLQQIMQREQATNRGTDALLSPRLRELFAAQERLLTVAERCLGSAASISG